ncbi:MAG: hypothetical protein QM500_12535 [Methylococcales bacterium]
MALKHKIATASRNKIFLAGLFIRLLLVILFFPEIQKEWFVPFIVNIIEVPSFTPWETFLNIYNNKEAYPYGPVMILVNLPFVFIGWLTDILFSSNVFTFIGFKLSLFIADITLLLILVQVFSKNYREVLIYYWLSPIVIYVTYIHGQIDIIPVSLFMASLLFLKQEKIKKCAITIGIAISSKFSMLVAAPFLFLYLIVNKKYYRFYKQFLFWLTLSVIAIQAPFIFNEGFQQMVLSNEQTKRLLLLGLDYNQTISIFITPLVLILIFYLVWRQARINFDLLMAAVSIGFFAIILSNISPPGWYIWLTPFLVFHQIRHDSSAPLMVTAFSIVVVVFYTLTATSGSILFLDIDLNLIRESIYRATPEKDLSLMFTVIVALGLIIIMQIVRSSVRKNDYFRSMDKALSIGIAGGKTSGKMALASSIITLFGKHSVCHLPGNNYYRWDRHSPMWKTISKLNPRASLLMKYTNDALDLIFRRDITNGLYDSESGYFSKMRVIKSNDIVLISGFHAFFSENLRQQLDLKIFLEIDETLEPKFNYIASKTDTDTDKSKHNVNNLKDTIKFINCQREYADIIFKLEPLNTSVSNEDTHSDPQLKLTTTIRRGIYYVDLQRAFIGLCNLNANLQLSEEIGTAILETEGELEFRGEDAALAIQMICPDIYEILDINPEWKDGMLGIMQVIILAGINQALQERRQCQ